MATEQDNNGHAPELVGNVFVEQYYSILTTSPSEVHKFYQDKSEVSRPNTEGAMSSATTLTGINKLILSLDCANCIVQILSADAQRSLGNGIMVLVTGFMTGKDTVRRKFTQVFFLVPEGERYYVLNDILRHVDEGEVENIKVTDVDDDGTTAPVTPDPEPISVPNGSAPVDPPSPSEEAAHPVKESSHPSDNGEVPTAEKEVDADQSVGKTSQRTSQPVSEVTASKVLEDAPKKSYASVANALNFKKEPFQQKLLASKPVEKVRATAAPEVSPRPTAPAQPPSNNGAEKSNNVTVKGHSVFVANLPMDATVEQLVEVFEKFGPIKPNGVQVRSYKMNKNCFGFVEFESADSMQTAIQAREVMIGNRRAFIEEKNADDERGGKYPSRKGGFRNDDFRNRGNYGGGRGYGRSDFENRGGFPGQARDSSIRNGENGQKIYQNGRGRATRQAQGGKN